jgi:hypothetical protein
MPATSELRRASWRKYGAKRRATPEYREQQRQWNGAWHEAHREDAAVKARKAQQQQCYRNDPALRPRYEARWLVNRAVAAGRLDRQPCEVCGLKAEKHHDDYSKPLEIRWLCRRHHRDHHSKATGAT